MWSWQACTASHIALCRIMVRDNASPALPVSSTAPLSRQHRTASVQPQSEAGMADLSLAHLKHGGHRGRCPHTNGVPHRDLIAAHVVQPPGHICCCSRLHLALQSRPPLQKTAWLSSGRVCLRQGMVSRGQSCKTSTQYMPCAINMKSSGPSAYPSAL